MFSRPVRIGVAAAAAVALTAGGGAVAHATSSAPYIKHTCTTAQGNVAVVTQTVATKPVRKKGFANTFTLAGQSPRSKSGGIGLVTDGVLKSISRNRVTGYTTSESSATVRAVLPNVDGLFVQWCDIPVQLKVG